MIAKAQQQFATFSRIERVASRSEVYAFYRGTARPPIVFAYARRSGRWERARYGAFDSDDAVSVWEPVEHPVAIARLNEMLRIHEAAQPKRRRGRPRKGERAPQPTVTVEVPAPPLWTPDSGDPAYLRPLDHGLGGIDDCYERGDAYGRFIYGRRPDDVWFSWNAKLDSWETLNQHVSGRLEEQLRLSRAWDAGFALAQLIDETA